MTFNLTYNFAMRATVYIETTVPSYYCDNRPELAADIARTKQWWDEERLDYDCFISEVVLSELAEGHYPNRENCLAMIETIPALAITEEIEQITAVYQARKLMPQMPVRDALHVAFASYYRIDFLLTWNCKHLANANKARHLRELNLEMGLYIPQLITPDQLQPWENQS
jgi:predicted nucleic acid-binding protein